MNNPCIKSNPFVEEGGTIMKTPVWVVKEVIPKEDYTLLITFADDGKRVYNALPLLQKPIFADLKACPFS